MVVLSVWIKNPMTSFSKYDDLTGVNCHTEENLLTLIRLRQIEGGFIIKEVKRKIIDEEGKLKFVEYELDCLTKYAERHKDSNQALWKVIVTVMEGNND